MIDVMDEEISEMINRFKYDGYGGETCERSEGIDASRREVKFGVGEVSPGELYHTIYEQGWDRDTS